MTRGAAVWRPVVMLPLFYPADSESISAEALCLESVNVRQL